MWFTLNTISLTLTQVVSIYLKDFLFLKYSFKLQETNFKKIKIF